MNMIRDIKNTYATTHMKLAANLNTTRERLKIKRLARDNINLLVRDKTTRVSSIV